MDYTNSSQEIGIIYLESRSNVLSPISPLKIDSSKETISLSSLEIPRLKKSALF